MRILVLMPTYGRPSLVANALACYLAQDYGGMSCLWIWDDANQIKSQVDRGACRPWCVTSYEERFATITAKYQSMLRDGEADGFGAMTRSFDAIALMDDDDIYGPSWLSSHARALENARWSYPRQVLTLHQPPSTGYGQPGTEFSHGRFWASSAVRLDLLREMGGFIQTPAADFDLQHLARWQELGGDPGRPDELLGDDGKPIGPQYVYGWGRANHCSRKMHKPDWYQIHDQLERARVERLEPLMDDETRAIYRGTWGVTVPQPAVLSTS